MYPLKIVRYIFLISYSLPQRIVAVLSDLFDLFKEFRVVTSNRPLIVCDVEKQGSNTYNKLRGTVFFWKVFQLFIDINLYAKLTALTRIVNGEYQ